MPRKKSILDCQKIAKERKGECISKVYINAHSPLIWKCSQNHSWKAPYKHVNNSKSWCPFCAGLIPKTSSDYYLIGNKYNLTFNDKVTNTETKVKWICNQCSNSFLRTYSKLREYNECPKCKNTTENKVRTIFETILKEPFPSVRPNFLKNEKTGRNLELDGFCEKLNLAFEYDGRFHEEEYSNKPLTSKQLKRHGNLALVKYRDRLKDKLCKKVGIKLIRISRHQKKNLETYIKQQIGEINDF